MGYMVNFKCGACAEGAAILCGRSSNMPSNWQKMKKSRLVQLALNPFFGWFRVPYPSLVVKKKCSDPSLQFWWVAGKKVQHSKNNMQMLGWCCEWWKKPHNISWTHQQQHRVGGQSSLSFQNKQIQFRIERTRIWLRIGNGKEKRIQILKIQCNTTT